MFKKMVGVFTSIVAGLAVVGVAWATSDDETSSSATVAAETSASVGADVSTPTTDVTVPDSSSTRVDASTSSSADASTSTRANASTSTSAEATTSTSVASTTSTSSATSTSTSVDDNDDEQVPDEITTHVIPGVGTVTIEAFAGQLFLADVTAPGWNVEKERIENDRIRLEFTSGLSAEAEFEARINNGRVEVRIDVDLS